ncbi:MAG TPA: MFS transporter [Candidatus Nanopelagicales bacterium]|nr:MFS transporter [Candidatus Nanopelagicales bacterium]
MISPPAQSAAQGSTWSPLQTPVYRMLWLGALASNLGLWMQNVAASWDMTALAPSPVYVALLQTAASLPVFLVGVPAAALGDILDRRRMLIAVGAWMALASLALAGLSATGQLGPIGLLGLTFALGLGFAFAAPLWQAVLPRLVSPAELTAAVTLSGVAINLARAVGPALGGFALGLFGSRVVYLLNAVLYGAMIVQVVRYRPATEQQQLPPERVAGAIAAGLRFARHAPALRAVLVRTGAVILGASGLWALLPVVARRELGMSPLGFGALLGAVGAGALLGAVFLPRLRARLGVDGLVAVATVVYAGAMLVVGWLRMPAALWPAMVASGVAWIALMSSLNVAAASAAPGWVQSRALGVYLLVFQGGLAIGSLIWGAIAARTSTPVALAAAAGVTVLGLVTGLRYRLEAARKEDVAPWSAWPDPTTHHEVSLEAGPVVIQRAYTVSEENRGAFLKAMRALEHVRRRDGAIAWGLHEDVERAGEFVESFTVATWAEHLRQHRRTVAGDQAIEDRVRELGKPHEVRHFVDAWSPERPRHEH